MRIDLMIHKFSPKIFFVSWSRKIYWTDGNTINVANMDGSNRKVLHQNQREPVGMSDFRLSANVSLLPYSMSKFSFWFLWQSYNHRVNNHTFKYKRNCILLIYLSLIFRNLYFIEIEHLYSYLVRFPRRKSCFLLYLTVIFNVQSTYFACHHVLFPLIKKNDFTKLLFKTASKIHFRLYCNWPQLWSFVLVKRHLISHPNSLDLQ